ncbi:hypothetical protein EA14781_007_00180 [Escherichia albertii NBRC 107761 = DSM 17582]|nr:hypothetical protein EA14781_007_00180 [Escherichia albertii NBRC 107761 = DSM 17582]
MFRSDLFFVHSGFFNATILNVVINHVVIALIYGSHVDCPGALAVLKCREYGLSRGLTPFSIFNVIKREMAA